MGTLLNGIKDIFATAKTTGSNVMLCGNDGTPDGHITMANLASVLGALTSKGYSADDWDKITDNGIYSVSMSTSTSGAPTGAYQWGTLVVVRSKSSGGAMGIVQMYFENDTKGGRVWQRNRWQDSSGFRPWMELTTNMPTFYKEYSDLSSLASAMCTNLTITKGKFVNLTNGQQKMIEGTQRGGLLIVSEASGGLTQSVDIKYLISFEATSILNGLADVRRDSANSNILIRCLSSQNTISYTFIGSSM